MAKVNPELKAKLVSAGLWAEFQHFRAEWVARGDKPAVANAKAESRFEAKLGGYEEKLAEKPVVASEKPDQVFVPVVAPKPVATPESAGNEALNVGGRPSKAQMIRDERKKDVSVPSEQLASLEEFGGKTCSVADQVIWVARYMDIEDVPKSICPDPAAWSLRNACRNSPLFATEFWTRMYAKAIPSKIKDIDEQSEEKYDGKGDVDLCEKLMSIKAVPEEEE